MVAHFRWPRSQRPGLSGGVTRSTRTFQEANGEDPHYVGPGQRLLAWEARGSQLEKQGIIDPLQWSYIRREGRNQRLLQWFSQAPDGWGQLHRNTVTSLAGHQNSRTAISVWLTKGWAAGLFVGTRGLASWMRCCRLMVRVLFLALICPVSVCIFSFWPWLASMGVSASEKKSLSRCVCLSWNQLSLKMCFGTNQPCLRSAGSCPRCPAGSRCFASGQASVF